MTWVFRPATDCFQESISEWDALNQSIHNHILLDSGFVSLLLRHFGGHDIWYGRSTAPLDMGAILVVKKAPGIWETFQPSQAPLGPLLLSSCERIQDSLRELMAGLPGLALQFAATQLDPDFTTLPPSLAGDLVEYLPHLRTPRLILRGSAQEYWAGRKKKLRENLSRYRRRLEAAGHRLQFTVLRQSADVAAGMREYSRLESTGWKGKDGSAVTFENEQGTFYREVLEYFCGRSEGMICQLYAGDKVIASRLALVRNGMMVMLKTAYDEGFASYAPGMLLMQELVSHLYAERQIKTIEFYGKVNEWHTHWTEDFREIYHLNFFRKKWVGKARALATRLR
jgi:Acetyltransferase (GNAT) domain